MSFLSLRFATGSLSQGTLNATGVVPLRDDSARWLMGSDDNAWGCECADPALQIELWARDAAHASASTLSASAGR